MSRIHIDDILPGMILATDLSTSSGRFLAEAGTALEEKHLRIMRIWGVTEAEIANADTSPKDPAPGIDPKVLERATSHVNACFEYGNLDQEAMAEIHRLTLQRTAQRLANAASTIKRRQSDGPHLPPEISETPPPTAADMVRMEVELSSLPDVYLQIRKVLDNPNASATHLAEAVGRDPNLAARLLRLVNSPFYGLSSAVDSLTRAVTVIGVKELSTLAMGVCTMRHFQGIPPEVYDMESFWRHTLLCALCAKILAGYQKSMSEERFFVAGLLHDLGRLVMVRHFPESSAQAIFETLVRHIDLRQAEEVVFGYDHGAVTGALLTAWNFPESLASMTAFHHNPEECPQVMDASLLHVADVLAHAMAVPQDPFLRMPVMFDAAWKRMRLPVSALATIMSQVDHMYRDIKQPLLG